MSPPRPAGLTLLLTLISAPALWAGAERCHPVYLDAQEEPLPFQSDDEVLDFLRSARIISVKELATGITDPRKLQLETNGIQAHAIFHDIDRKESALQHLSKDPVVQGIRDSYRNQVAAYELARLLGICTVPPTVERRVRGVPGSVQLWIEAALTERQRAELGMHPPDANHWSYQIADLRVFDNLIGNIDRNQGNILIDEDWNLWLIDHTRAFGGDDKLPSEAKLLRISRPLWETLQALDWSTVDHRLGPYLAESELKALKARHRKIVRRFEAQIAKSGKEAVVLDAEPTATPDSSKLGFEPRRRSLSLLGGRFLPRQMLRVGRSSGELTPSWGSVIKGNST